MPTAGKKIPSISIALAKLWNGAGSKKLSIPSFKAQPFLCSDLLAQAFLS
jgi:hypothetical protein